MLLTDQLSKPLDAQSQIIQAQSVAERQLLLLLQVPLGDFGVQVALIELEFRRIDLYSELAELRAETPKLNP